MKYFKIEDLSKDFYINVICYNGSDFLIGDLDVKSRTCSCEEMVYLENVTHVADVIIPK